MSEKPLAIDLFCGLGGWTDGLLAEGYFVVGFDIEQHEYWVPDVSLEGDGHKGTKPVAKRGWTQRCAVSLGLEGEGARERSKLLRYPGSLVIQDVLTLHGSQFKDAALIVASPPCQRYSYMAMPWKRAKAQAAEIRADVSGEMLADLNALFDACFRIKREASEAAGRDIPLVVENVRGAIPWVGRSRWNFGSFHLWGDVPALMPHVAARKLNGFRFDGSGKGRNPVHELAGTKGSEGYDRDHPTAFGWKKPGTSSHSKARKAASALIAKIPLTLSRHIGATFKPKIAAR